MRAFRISGKFRMGRGLQKFTKEIAASGEAEAKEKLLSDLGSKHRVKRRDIRIERVKEVSKEEISDSIVRFLVERGGG